MILALFMWGDDGVGGYDYMEITPIPAGAVDGYATPYVKAGGVGSGGDFGEVALNLTALGITDDDGCNEVSVGDQTGTAAGITTPSQIKDIVSTHTLKICGLDFDDLPDTYDPITDSDPYACTTSNPESPFIGAGVTNESNGWDDATANSDTDDGIPGAWPLWEAGTCTGLLPDGSYGDVIMDEYTYCFTVKATNQSATDAQLVAWIDWNDDGLFQDTERSELVLDGSTGNVPAGTINEDVVLYWEDPTLQLGETYARLRITTDAEFKSSSSPTPHGATSDGEIEGYLIPENSLPVELSSFTATAAIDGVHLNWTTESETENLGFILERRTEGTDWTEIASYKTDDGLLGQGSTPSATDYEYLDNLVQAGTEYEYRLADVDHHGVVTYQATRSVTVEQTPLTSLVKDFTVLPAYPNPFNPITTIRYGLEDDGRVTVDIYDISGKLISTLQDKNQTQGWHSITWNGTNQHGKQVPAGLYLSRITSGNEVKTIKLMLLK
ncbi:FlgD immunoglobulin-like domain containing protein, partial [Candidatus Neomarinimicrobiota bacterium]